MADETPQPPDPVLELKTLSQGLPFTIDGVRYEIAHPDRLSLAAIRRVEVRLPIIGALLKNEFPTEREEQETTRLLVQVCRDILPDVPEEVRAALSNQQRVQITETFLPLRSWKPRGVAGAQAAPTPGERPSQG